MCPDGMEAFNEDANWSDESGVEQSCGNTWYYCSANPVDCGWDQLDDTTIQSFFANTDCCDGSEWDDDSMNESMGGNQ